MKYCETTFTVQGRTLRVTTGWDGDLDTPDKNARRRVLVRIPRFRSGMRAMRTSFFGYEKSSPPCPHAGAIKGGTGKFVGMQGELTCQQRRSAGVRAERSGEINYSGRMYTHEGLAEACRIGFVLVMRRAGGEATKKSPRCACRRTKEGRMCTDVIPAILSTSTEQLMQHAA